MSNAKNYIDSKELNTNQENSHTPLENKFHQQEALFWMLEANRHLLEYTDCIRIARRHLSEIQ